MKPTKGKRSSGETVEHLRWIFVKLKRLYKTFYQTKPSQQFPKERSYALLARFKCPRCGHQRLRLGKKGWESRKGEGRASFFRLSPGLSAAELLVNLSKAILCPY